MAVVSVAEDLPNSPRLTAGLNKRTHVREFRVLTDSKADAGMTVTAAPGIPLMYSPYVFGNERDDYALVRDIGAERFQPASLWWKVTVTYETPEPVGGAGGAGGNASQGTQREQQGQFENPLLMLPEVSTSMEKFQEVVWAVYDVTTGKLTPCKASNGQVFDPPPMRDASRLVLTITRNESLGSAHPAVDVAYQDAVNSDGWWGCLPGQWKVQAISTNRETKQLPNGNVYPYLKVTYKFEARPTWDLQILDAGSFHLIDDPNFVPVPGGPVFNDLKVQFMTFDNHPLAAGPLDGFGRELPAGANPVFLRLRTYPRLPFGKLDLPQAFSQTA